MTHPTQRECCEKCFREGEVVVACGCPCHSKQEDAQPEWVKEFWGRFADKDTLTYKNTNPQAMADFISSALETAYREGQKEASSIEIMKAWHDSIDKTSTEQHKDWMDMSEKLLKLNTNNMKEPKKCDCGEQEILGGAEVEIGGVCHRPNNPCYVLPPTPKNSEWEIEFDRKFLFKSKAVGDPACEYVATPNIIQDTAELKSFILSLLQERSKEGVGELIEKIALLPKLNVVNFEEDTGAEIRGMDGAKTLISLEALENLLKEIK